MGNQVAALSDLIRSSNIEAGNSQRQSGGVSFERVLQNKTEQSRKLDTTPAPTDTQLEQMRANLIQQLAQLPAGDPSNTVLSQLIDSRTRLNLLAELSAGVGTGPARGDMLSRLSHLENRWYDLERIWQSGATLSETDLLVLQAQLYGVSEDIELLAKMVDQITSGVKTILHATG